MKENKIKVFDGSKRLIDLSEYAVEGRYAVIYDDLEDANKYIKILEKLVEFVKAEIMGVDGESSGCLQELYFVFIDLCSGEASEKNY